LNCNILSWRRKERHQRHQQQQQQQQPPAQPISTRERRFSEPTSEPEPGRDLESRSPRSTPAPKQTYPHTYPTSRRKSRISTSQTGQRRSQIPSSNTPPNIVRLGPEPGPSTPVPTPAQPNNEHLTASAPAPSLPPPLPLPLPTPCPTLLPPPHQPQEQQQRKRMATEHRDQRDGKPGLRTWWQHITTTQKPRPPASDHHARSVPSVQSLPQEYVPPPPGMVFGRPLKDSLRYASVQISTADASGRLYVWGYIPVVVAKWCVHPFSFISLIPLSIRSTSPSEKKSTHIPRSWAAVAYIVVCS
jgi:hypothetical protein